MSSLEIRETFLRFFEERGHRRVRSSSLVPASDPTLLFTNAGMNQFKQVFLGLEQRGYVRAASSQKCLRVSGKHNDLDQVGRTPRHHTFFEMLGNFSFGDYFKREAIGYAWELLTEVYKLPAERLWATVFGGEAELGPDEEAERVWLEEVRVLPARFRRYGAAENFWSMGETGPCGPCSEIHWDHGPAAGCGRSDCEPSCPCGRFLELWNLVFMQFQRTPEGALEPLPKPNIDTGMGLERIASVLQGVGSNYETDLFRPLIVRVEELTGRRYGASPEADVSMRVIADHLRAVTFLIADGVAPSNEKRGYVLRRLLRRGILHGKRLGLDPPFLHSLTDSVVDRMKGAYPELLEAREHIDRVVKREEEQFERTLSVGLGLLDQAIAQTKARGETNIPGRELFRLYDTFGLPLDLARDLAEQHGLGVDEAGFAAEMERQRERARRSWSGMGAATPPAIYISVPGAGECQFLGYQDLVVEETLVLAIIKDGRPVESLREGEEGEVLLDATPFYPEGGGQVGDVGVLAGPHAAVRVIGTESPAPGMIVHRVRVEEGALQRLERVRAEVEGRLRLGAMRNHTATHLLHAALREILGPHVKQAGSLVAPDRLRFDFSHFKGLDEGLLAGVEELVNEKILEDLPVETEKMPLDKALRAGAIALFGEKYGDVVRVCRIGDFSLELCGGTHTSRTGQIGVFKFVGEKGVSSGVRRVDAVTGEGALKRFQEDSGILRQVESVLSVPRPELVEGLTRRLSATREMQKEIERLRRRIADGEEAEVQEKVVEVGGHRVVARRADGLSGPEMRELADTIRQRIGSGVVILARAEDGKASLLVAVTPDLTGRVPAGALVRQLAPLVGGRGGGRPELAEAGGKDPAKLDGALAAGIESAKALLEGAAQGA
ncbi:MAG: alanine--tRNA ligase [Acidobacteria bacterium]|nr:MAG: alanine--tRNA ligase [Acidobacteriota bacterium]